MKLEVKGKAVCMENRKPEGGDIYLKAEKSTSLEKEKGTAEQSARGAESKTAERVGRLDREGKTERELGKRGRPSNATRLLRERER